MNMTKKKTALLLLTAFLVAFSMDLGYVVYASKKMTDDYYVFYGTSLTTCEGNRITMSDFVIDAAHPPASIPFPAENQRWVKKTIRKDLVPGGFDPEIWAWGWKDFPRRSMTWEEVQAELNPLGSPKVYRESAMIATIPVGIAGAVLYLRKRKGRCNHED